MKFAAKILAALSGLISGELVQLTDSNYVEAQAQHNYMLVAFCDERYPKTTQFHVPYLT